MIDLGHYHRLLTPYFDWFKKENIFIGVFEEFFETEESSCETLFEFLGVDSTFKPSVLGARINASTDREPGIIAPIRGHLMKLLNYKPLVPVMEILHKIRVDRLASHVGRATTKSTEKKSNKSLSANVRRELLKQFEPDIQRLEKLLGRSLDIWRDGG